MAAILNARALDFNPTQFQPDCPKSKVGGVATDTRQNVKKGVQQELKLHNNEKDNLGRIEGTKNGVTVNGRRRGSINNQYKHKESTGGKRINNVDVGCCICSCSSKNACRCLNKNESHEPGVHNWTATYRPDPC